MFRSGTIGPEEPLKVSPQATADSRRLSDRQVIGHNTRSSSITIGSRTTQSMGSTSDSIPAYSRRKGEPTACRIRRCP